MRHSRFPLHLLTKEHYQSTMAIEYRNYLGRSVDELPTPCLVVDQKVMRRNMVFMQDYLKRKGKALRPHAKTHKSSRIAALQRENGAIGICVAKLSEAEALIAKGVGGVLITGPVATSEAQERLVQCLPDAPDLMLALDDLETARILSQKLSAKQLSLSCLVDLDVGQRRSGLPLAEAVDFARTLNTFPCLKVCGVQAYAGHLQHIASYEQRVAQSSEALNAAASVFRELREIGLSMEIFSAGGTGTAWIDADIPEVTEIQAGSYLFMDQEYAEIEWPIRSGDKDSAELSLALLSSVVSNHHAGFVTIDAGLKAMYRDGATPKVINPPGEGFSYDWFGDEYGKITFNPEGKSFAVGEKVILSVSHGDPTVNLFDAIFVVEDGVVTDVYPVDLRGCSQ